MAGGGGGGVGAGGGGKGQQRTLYMIILASGCQRWKIVNQNSINILFISYRFEFNCLNFRNFYIFSI